MGQQPPAAPRNDLPASKRLRQSCEFEQVRQEGRRLTKGCLILNWLKIEGRNFSRLGVVTSRKIGGAVQRSRARRLMRECFRLHQHHLVANLDIVLVARPSITGKIFSEVERDYLAALKEARMLK